MAAVSAPPLTTKRAGTKHGGSPSSRADLATSPPHTRGSGGGAADLAQATVGGAVAIGDRLGAAANEEVGGSSFRPAL